MKTATGVGPLSRIGCSPTILESLLKTPRWPSGAGSLDTPLVRGTNLASGGRFVAKATRVTCLFLGQRNGGPCNNLTSTCSTNGDQARPTRGCGSEFPNATVWLAAAIWATTL